MSESIRKVSFQWLTRQCDVRNATQIATKKVRKVIICDVPCDMFASMTVMGKGIAIVAKEQKIILYDGPASLIVPCTRLGGKHVLQVICKKCGTMSVHRYNNGAMRSSPDRI